VDKGHGRIDQRSIETLSQLPSLVEFPGANQIGRIRRERSIKDIVTVEIRINGSPAAPDIVALIQHWPSLPEHIRAPIMALVGTVKS